MPGITKDLHMKSKDPQDRFADKLKSGNKKSTLQENTTESQVI